MKQEFLPHGIELIEKISIILNNKYYETANRVIRVKVFKDNTKSQLIILLGAYEIYAQEVTEEERKAFLALSSISRKDENQSFDSNLDNFLSTIPNALSLDLKNISSIFHTLTSCQNAPFELDLEIHDNGFTLYAFEDVNLVNFDSKIKALNEYFDFCRKYNLFK